MCCPTPASRQSPWQSRKVSLFTFVRQRIGKPTPTPDSNFHQFLVGNMSKCNWCCQVKRLLATKKFCMKCSLQGKECRYCHRPMPERFYTLSENVCNSCFKKHEKQKRKRRSLSRSRSLFSRINQLAEREGLECIMWVNDDNRIGLRINIGDSIKACQDFLTQHGIPYENITIYEPAHTFR